MFEHLSNCHGEWNVVIALVSSVPFVGIWLQVKLKALLEKKHNVDRISQEKTTHS